ncbi:MAG: recombinase family protein, partial [Mucilaginibacter sp.]
FRHEGADLISLSENIDTSSPAGRLFFTIISAMAEWEREEIASRVAASVPIRAKMGKPLGGQGSYGYRWDGKELVIDETEAPVRKLLYELFLKHQRKKSTADALNALGYRTRNGSAFSDTTVARLLRDPTAKGERIANYTKSLGDGKQWVLKPESEWIRLPCPAIVTPEIWNECNTILDTQEGKRRKPGPKAVHLLSGLVQCSCGKTMYVFHSSRVFSCKACKNRIGVDDLDEIYQTYLQDYLNGINPAEYAEQTDAQLEEKRTLLATTTKERNRLAKRMNELLNLRLDGELSKESFALEYKPMEERVAQLDSQLPQLEAEIDVRTIQLLSTDKVLTDAKALYEQWSDMSFEQKRGIVETITTGIEIGKEDITINLAYAPPVSQNTGKSQHNFRGSYSPPA